MHRLSNMESNRESASELLSALDNDREKLTARAITPWWIPVGFGVLGAAYVATPALPEGGPRNFVLVAAILLTMAMIGAYRRVTGVRASVVGVRAWIVAGLAVASTWVLISVSYALVSFELYWWVIAPAVAGFAVLAALAVLVTSWIRERVRA